MKPESQKPESRATKKAINNIITVAVFSAAAVALGLIKIPSPAGSIALDSAPGYFGAVFFGPWIGGAIGTLGHIGSAASAGFPLGALHIVVAVQMFLWCAAFGWIARRGNSLYALAGAAVVAIILNGVASPFLLIPFGLPQVTAFQLMPFLLFASAANIALAAASAKALSSLNIRGI